MPEKQTLGTCSICHSPSPTVVCLRCFFNYDYRTYDTGIKEDRIETVSELVPVTDFSEPIRLSDWHTEWNERELETPIEPEESHEKPPYISWFSRLPRFSCWFLVP